MAEIGRWSSYRFEVSPNVVRGFSGLTMKGSCETEDKTESNQKYVARKNGKPSEVSMTVHLDARLGCDVRGEALALVECASSGERDYFYIGNRKLMSCRLMLTDASVSEVTVAPDATWITAKVQLTMKQSSKGDGEESEAKRGKRKRSVRKGPPATKETDRVEGLSGHTSVPARFGPSAADRTISDARKAVENATVTAVGRIEAITKAAKKLTQKLLRKNTATSGAAGVKLLQSR